MDWQTFFQLFIPAFVGGVIGSVISQYFIDRKKKRNQ